MFEHSEYPIDIYNNNIYIYTYIARFCVNYKN